MAAIIRLYLPLRILEVSALKSLNFTKCYKEKKSSSIDDVEEIEDSF